MNKTDLIDLISSETIGKNIIGKDERLYNKENINLLREDDNFKGSSKCNLSTKIDQPSICKKGNSFILINQDNKGFEFGFPPRLIDEEHINFDPNSIKFTSYSGSEDEDVCALKNFRMAEKNITNSLNKLRKDWEEDSIRGDCYEDEIDKSILDLRSQIIKEGVFLLKSNLECQTSDKESDTDMLEKRDKILSKTVVLPGGSIENNLLTNSSKMDNQVNEEVGMSEDKRANDFVTRSKGIYTEHHKSDTPHVDENIESVFDDLKYSSLFGGNSKYSQFSMYFNSDSENETDNEMDNYDENKITSLDIAKSQNNGEPENINEKEKHNIHSYEAVDDQDIFDLRSQIIKEGIFQLSSHQDFNEFSSADEDSLAEDIDEHLLKKVRMMISSIKNSKDMLEILKARIMLRHKELLEEFNTQKTNVLMPTLLKRKRTGTILQNYCPYFKDKDNFPCWLNDDAKQKHKENYPSVYSYLKRRSCAWNSSDRKNLIYLIKEQIISEEMSRFKDGMKCQYITNSNKNHIFDIIQSKSLDELLAQTPDRDFDWDDISLTEQMRSRHTSTNCSLYWHNYLKPSINKSDFTKDEDEMLLKLAEEYNGENWEKIVEELGTNRSAFQAFSHYRVRFPHAVKNSVINDADLMKLIKTNTLPNNTIAWNKISSLTGLNVRKIWHRWWYNIHPDIIKGRFTKEEDILILSGIQEYGFCSSILSRILKHRTPKQILGRSKILTSSKFITGPWKIHEDELLIKLVKKYGVGSWSKIAKQFITRNRTQVRQRYSILKEHMDKNNEYDLSKLQRNCVDSQEIKKRNLNKVVKTVQTLKFNKVIDGDKDIYSKYMQINDLKKILFSRKPKEPTETKESILDTKLTSFFIGYYHPFKMARKSDTENISYLTTKVLYFLGYFKINALKTSKKNIEEIDKFNDLSLSVLTELLNDNEVFNFQLSEFYSTLRESQITEVDEKDLASLSVKNRLTNCNVTKSIDYIPDNQKHTVNIIDYNPSAEISFQKAKTSELIYNSLSDFSYGIYSFLKSNESSHSASTSKDSLVNHTNTHDHRAQAQVDTYDNFYKLPMNVSTIILLRTIIANRHKLLQNVKKTYEPNQNIFHLTEDIPEEASKSTDIPQVKYTRKFTLFSKETLRSPEERNFIAILNNILYWTLFLTENLNNSVEREQPIVKNTTLKPKQVKQIYCNDSKKKKFKRKKNK
uniref:snRNA-activating protein complex subunit 4 n=1 Tax=Clastoptera arizonana TaxID=38151 RepID=A0A1B6ECZ0_9HEMI